MKTPNRTLTAGVRTLPGARSSGSFWHNGFGISVSNWGTRCVPRPCVRRNLFRHRRENLRKLPLIRSPGHLNQLPSPMERHSGHVHRTPKDLLAQISLSNRMGRCAVQQAALSIHKSADQSAMAHSGYCMQRGSAIVARVRFASSVRESATTIKARRVSAVYWPVSSPPSISGESSPAPEESFLSPSPQPVLWGDWQRRFHRREVVKLLRHQRVDVQLAETSPPAQSPPVRLLSRAERAHWRLSWAERLARNARPKSAPDVSIMLFGIPDAFATALGLHIA